MAETDYDSGAYCAMGDTAASVEAVSGAEILTCVFDSTGANLLAIEGEQESTLTIEAETSSVATKDTKGAWSISRPAGKSWTLDTTTVIIKDAKAGRVLREALDKNLAVCVKQVYDDEDYTALGGGMGYVTSYEQSAPSDDNATASISITGSGKWTWFDIDTTAAAEATAKPSNRAGAGA